METPDLAASPTRAKTERGGIQKLLDREFPDGALAALVIRDRGRIESGESRVTGRLVCERSESDESGTWWHCIVIDPSTCVADDPDVVRLWAGTPHRCHDSRHLWEAEVRTSERTTAVLRLNGNPPEQWRPTEEMRRAVTERYADLLKAPVGAA